MGKRINAVYRTSVTEDSTVAAKAGVKYEIAFRHGQWVFSVDQCISCLFFLSLYFDYDFHNK